MANMIPNSFKEKIGNGSIDLDSNQLRIMLLKGTHSNNADTQEYLADIQANEIESSGEYIKSSSGGASNTVINTTDKTQRRALDDFAEVGVWAGANRVILSEMGVPYDDDSPAYVAVITKVFQALNALGWSSAAWTVGQTYGSAYRVVPFVYNTMADNGVSAPFKANAGKNGTQIHMINLSGGEFSLNPDAVGPIGTEGTQYHYHLNSGMWAAVKAKGYTHTRFPVRLERMFDTISGAWLTGAKAKLEAAIQESRDEGLKMLIDPHNYGAMQINNARAVISGSAFPINLYNEMMKNIAQLAIDNADVIDIIGLMNEPKNIKVKREEYATFGDLPQFNPVTPQDYILYKVNADNSYWKWVWGPDEYQNFGADEEHTLSWEEISQSALDAIRAQGWTGDIEVPCGNWQGIQDVVNAHTDGPWITDSQNNHQYGVHQYYDINYGGAYNSTYAADEIGNTYPTVGGDVTIATTGTDIMGGKTITGLTLAANNLVNKAVLDGDDVSFNNSPITAAYGAIYVAKTSLNDSPIVGIIDFGGDKTSTAGNNFTIVWPSTGILTIS